MLKISPTQFSAFADYGRESFIKQAVAHLAKTAARSPNAKSPEQLRAFVGAGIERAGNLAITTERDVLSLMELELQYGERFWASRPYLAEIVQQLQVSADFRMQEVRKRLSSATASIGQTTRKGL